MKFPSPFTSPMLLISLKVFTTILSIDFPIKMASWSPSINVGASGTCDRADFKLMGYAAMTKRNDRYLVVLIIL